MHAIQIDAAASFVGEFEIACQQRGIRLFVLPLRSPNLKGAVERANRTHIEEFLECVSMRRKPTSHGLTPFECRPTIGCKPSGGSIMANPVLGIASPHAFGGGTPEMMEANREKDRTDSRMNYPELLERAQRERPWLADEVTVEKMQARYNKALEGVKALAHLLQETAPDVLVVVGDDQYEQFQDDNMPMFCIYRGATMPTGRRSGEARQRTGSRAWTSPLWEQVRQRQGASDEIGAEQPSAPGLGEHLIRFMVEEGFDVASSNQMKPEMGLGHAFTFVYNHLIPPGSIPMLPVMVNTFFPPNNPTPRRCVAFGRALREGIEAWESDKKVAVLASGGLSHTVVDEGVDRMLLDAIVEQSPEGLSSMPVERMGNGTSELRNWIIVAGAMEDRDFEFLLPYIASYRTEAGTGNGLAVGYWK